MKPRYIFALALAILLAVFALQNSDQLTVRLLFWSFSLPQSVLILSSSALGLGLGWLLGISVRKPAQ